jgi:hypothetical protein
MSSARKNRSPAAECVDMWEKSQGHLENILRNSDLVAVGIAFTSSGTFYCTQTFGSQKEDRNTDDGSEKCRSFAVSAERGAHPAPANTYEQTKQPHVHSLPSDPDSQGELAGRRQEVHECHQNCTPHILERPPPRGPHMG